MSNTEVFIDKYKQLEAAIRTQFPETRTGRIDSPVFYIENLARFKRYRAACATCREIRNLLQHHMKIDGEYCITPSDGAVATLDKLITAVTGGKKCSEIAIHYSDIYWRSLDDSVKEAMQVMRERTFTHVPILNADRRVIGVFDENSVFEYLTAEGIVDIDDDLRFGAIQKYLSVTGREMEEFLFVDPGMPVDELEALIEGRFQKNRRVGMAFLTAGGRQSSSLYGIVTPWDILGNDTQ